MNKNLKIRPTVAQFDGDLVESYERVTNASKEKLESLGLDPNQQHYAKIGTAPVTEYVRLIAKYMKQNDTQSWKIADIGQVIEVDSIYIDAPNQDSFDLEVYDSKGEKLLDLTIGRNKSPYDLPNAPLTEDLTLVIRARNTINTCTILCRPAVLLADYLSTELQAAIDKQK